MATVQLAKGVNFRVVRVTAYEDEVLRLTEGIAKAVDPGELKELLESDRHLLCVARTFAQK
jgi:hypothetical protein